MKPILYETFSKGEAFVIYRNDILLIQRNKEPHAFSCIAEAVGHMREEARKDDVAARRLGLVLSADATEFQNSCGTTQVRLTVSFIR